MRLTLLVATLTLVALPAAADGCGTPAGRCETRLGFYRLALPEAAEGPVPAFLYLHGWGASSEGIMSAPVGESVTARGYALIAPEGVARPGSSQRDWGVRDGGEHPRDDLAFLAEVLDDAGSRGVDRDRVLLTGFSRGGSMVWDAACRAPGLARAYASVAGAFWEPLAEGCAAPVRLFHTHGWTDVVVPIEGRSVAGGRLAQGDLFASLAILRAANGCSRPAPDTMRREAPGIWIRSWTGCSGGRIDLMLHPGGHAIPKGWAARALDWFEALGG